MMLAKRILYQLLCGRTGSILQFMVSLGVQRIEWINKNDYFLSIVVLTLYNGDRYFLTLRMPKGCYSYCAYLSVTKNTLPFTDSMEYLGNCRETKYAMNRVGKLEVAGLHDPLHLFKKQIEAEIGLDPFIFDPEP